MNRILILTTISRTHGNMNSIQCYTTSTAWDGKHKFTMFSVMHFRIHSTHLNEQTMAWVRPRACRQLRIRIRTRALIQYQDVVLPVYTHGGDKTVVRSSYLLNWISYTCKMTSWYWIRGHNTLLEYLHTQGDVQNIDIFKINTTQRNIL